MAQTNAIGLVAKAGRYGGTYAHKDIAFEFGMWISAEFKIYLIKEFQRLKDRELQQLGWDIRRNLTKINYRIHTDAIKAKLTHGQKETLAAAPGRIGELFPALPAEAVTTLPAGKEFPIFANQT